MIFDLIFAFIKRIPYIIFVLLVPNCILDDWKDRMLYGKERLGKIREYLVYNYSGLTPWK